MADILEEQRNPAFIISKRTFIYRANRPSKDPIRQNKSFKRTESFKPSNRRKKLDRGSNYNMHPEDDEEAFKDIKTKSESDPNPKLESFIYVIKNFDLDNSKSSCSISSLNSKNNVEDFETEDVLCFGP